MKRRHKELLKRLAYLSFEGSEGKCLSECTNYVAEYIERTFPKVAARFLAYYQMQLEKESLLRLVTVEVAGSNKISEKSILEVVDINRSQAKTVEEHKRPELIAGFRIRYQDWVWDASIATQLKQLTCALL